MIGRTNTEYSVRAVAIAACLGCAFFGITMFFWGAMLPALKNAVQGIEKLPWILTFGIILGTIISGALADRYGYKWLLLCSSLALAVGLCLFALLRTPVPVFLSTLMIGAGGGVLNSGTIALISDIYDDGRRSSMLSILGGCYCAGSLLWTVACRLYVSDCTVPTISSALLIAVYCAVFCFVRFPKAKAGKGEKFSLLNSLGLFRYRLLVIVAFLLYFEGMTEAVCSNYTTTYLTSFGAGGISLEVALTSLVFMTVGMMAGRFTLPFCLRTGGSAVSFYLFIMISLAGALMQFFLHSIPLAAFASMTALGFGLGVTAPVIFGYMGQVFRKYSGAAVALVVIVAQVGMIHGNMIAGALFSPESVESGIFRLFPLLPGALFVIMMLIFPFVVRSTANMKNKYSNL